MSDILVSVIVPVYKVEKYMDECITSICSSTLKNIEILLIDDGSPDTCGQKCDEWVLKDTRIKAFHKKNGGLSDARNYGLQFAQGEYILFVDSDDMIAPDMIEKLYDSCSRYKTKLSICDVLLWYPQDKEKSKRVGDLPDKLVVDTLNYQDFSYMYHNTAWRKLYHRSLFTKQTKFPVGIYHEDIGFWWIIMAKLDRLSIVNEPLYLYRQDNTGSICKDRNEQKHTSDTILSCHYGLFQGLKELNSKRKQSYQMAFLKNYLEIVYAHAATKKAKLAHIQILNALKSVALNAEEEVRNNYLKQPYFSPNPALIHLKILKDIQSFHAGFLLRLFGIKLVQLDFGAVPAE